MNPSVRVVRWSPREMRKRLPEAMEVYATAMDYSQSAGEQRAGYAAAHTRQRGFRSVVALADDERLVGFGYGYRLRRGQWWHDQVQTALGPAKAREWLVDGFELCELHVLPTWQGHGIGRHLLSSLSSLVDESRVLLSTPEGHSRARHLYERMGFIYLVREHYFPGDSRLFAILGARLPLVVTPTGSIPSQH